MPPMCRVSTIGAGVALAGSLVAGVPRSGDAQDTPFTLPLDSLQTSCGYWRRSAPADSTVQRECLVVDAGPLGRVGEERFYYALYRVLDREGGDDSASIRRYDAAPYNQTGILTYRLVPGTDSLAREIDGLGGWGFSWYARPAIVAAPMGPVLTVPLRYAGTGSLNDDAYYLRADGRWRRLETASWLADLKRFLPEGHAVWKGVVLDLASMRAESDVWRAADANCCPSGGRVEVHFGVRGDTLVIIRAVHHPPAAGP